VGSLWALTSSAPSLRSRAEESSSSGFSTEAGFKYQITPRFFIRADFRETLSQQPDYWTKSYPAIRSFFEPLKELFTTSIGRCPGMDRYANSFSQQASEFPSEVS
jgi:hypothetical protein